MGKKEKGDNGDAQARRPRRRPANTRWNGRPRHRPSTNRRPKHRIAALRHFDFPVKSRARRLTRTLHAVYRFRVRRPAVRNAALRIFRYYCRRTFSARTARAKAGEGKLVEYYIVRRGDGTEVVDDDYYYNIKIHDVLYCVRATAVVRGVGVGVRACVRVFCVSRARVRARACIYHTRMNVIWIDR